MPTPTKGPRLGSGPAHERLLLAGLASALFERGRVVTTETKAKRLRPLAERLITFAKRGDLHARRRVLAVIPAKPVVHRLFADIGPSYADRAGGYTRITKLGPRQGDGAPMAVIELVESRPATDEVVAEAERARGTRFRRRAAARTAVPATGDAAPATGAEAGPDAATGQIAVPTEGGDTEVVTAPAGGAEAPAAEAPAAEPATDEAATDATAADETVADETPAVEDIAVEPAGAPDAVPADAADEPPAEPAGDDSGTP